MTERTIAALCLYVKMKQVLMQHRGDDAPILPGHWGFFGGLVDVDETPEQTVRRELFEEIEYRPHKPEFFIKEKSMQGGIHVLTHIFIEEYDETQPLILHEGQEYGWFMIDDALNLKITKYRHASLWKIRGYLEELE